MSGFGLTWQQTPTSVGQFPSGTDWAMQPNGSIVEMDTMGVQQSYVNKYNGHAPNDVAMIQVTVRAMQNMALDEWTNFMTTQIMTSARLWIITRQWHPLFEAAPTAIGASTRMPTTEEVRHARGTDRIATSFQYDGEMLMNPNGLRNLRNIILTANRSLIIKKAMTTQHKLIEAAYQVLRARLAAGYFTRGFNQNAYRKNQPNNGRDIRKLVSDFYVHEAQTYAPLSQPGAKLSTTIYRIKAIHEKMNIGVNFNVAAICSMTEEVMSDEALRERRYVLNVGTKEINAIDVPASGRRLRIGDMRAVPAIPVPRQMMVDNRMRGRGLVVIDAKGSYALWEQRVPNTELGLLDEANNSYHWFSAEELIDNCVLFDPPTGNLRPAPPQDDDISGSIFHDEQGNPFRTFSQFFDAHVNMNGDRQLTEALLGAIMGAGNTRAAAEEIISGINELGEFMRRCAEAVPNLNDLRFMFGQDVANPNGINEYNAPGAVDAAALMAAIPAVAFEDVAGTDRPAAMFGMGSWEGIKRLVEAGARDPRLLRGYYAMRALMNMFYSNGVDVERSIVAPLFGGATRVCALNAFAPSIALFRLEDQTRLLGYLSNERIAAFSRVLGPATRGRVVNLNTAYRGGYRNSVVGNRGARKAAVGALDAVMAAARDIATYLATPQNLTQAANETEVLSERLRAPLAAAAQTILAIPANAGRIIRAAITAVRDAIGLEDADDADNTDVDNLVGEDAVDAVVEAVTNQVNTELRALLTGPVAAADQYVAGGVGDPGAAATVATNADNDVPAWLDAIRRIGVEDYGTLAADRVIAVLAKAQRLVSLETTDEAQSRQITAAVNRVSSQFRDRRDGLRAIYTVDFLSGLLVHHKCNNGPRTDALELLMLHIYNGASIGTLTEDDDSAVKKMRMIAYYAIKDQTDFRTKLDAILAVRAAGTEAEIRGACEALAKAAKTESSKVTAQTRFAELQAAVRATVPALGAPSGADDTAANTQLGNFDNVAGAVLQWVKVPGVTMSYEQAYRMINNAELAQFFRPSLPNNPQTVALSPDEFGGAAPVRGTLATRSVQARVGASADVSSGRNRDFEYQAEHVGAGADLGFGSFTVDRPFLARNGAAARPAYPPPATTGAASRLPLAVRVAMVALGSIPITRESTKMVARILPQLWRYLVIRAWRQRFTESMLLAVAGAPTSFSPTSNAFITREQMGDTEVVTKASCYHTTIVTEPQNLCLVDHARIFARTAVGHDKTFAGVTLDARDRGRLLEDENKPKNAIISMLVPNKEFEEKVINVFGDYNKDEAPMVHEIESTLTQQHAHPHYFGDAFMRSYFYLDNNIRKQQVEERERLGWGDRLVNWICLPEAIWERDPSGSVTCRQFSIDHLGHNVPGTSRMRAYDALPYATEPLVVTTQ